MTDYIGDLTREIDVPERLAMRKKAGELISPAMTLISKLFLQGEVADNIKLLAEMVQWCAGSEFDAEWWKRESDENAIEAICNAHPMPQNIEYIGILCRASG